jgi:hypothetical protein
MILLERLREIFVHLCLNTFFSVAKHRMGCERNNGSSLGAEASLILSNLSCGFKSSLSTVSKLRTAEPNFAYHDWHLHVHENNIVSLLLDSIKCLLTITDNCNDVVILF